MEKKKNMTVSVALAVFNEEKNLASCLDSVAGLADEIVVVDGGSTDKTTEIARRYNARVIRTDNPPMFHINKQKALDACKGVWILQLDADEVVTPELKKEILSVIGDPANDTNGYYIPRRNYFWGHFMKKGGQYPDEVIRLVRRGFASFPAKSVHEQIAVRGKVGHIREPMLHYAYRTEADYWRKADTYTSLTAKELRERHVPVTFASWVTYCLVKPVMTFLTLFVRHKGFMDGWHGLLFAWYSGIHHAIAYRKYASGKS